ncbi:MAG: hypothetical protein DMF84_28525 [Acidobacteria bacterium]|nr:MAG: hypothetical protein DMF84_28525 [Acidobacteriota bacterium]
MTRRDHQFGQTHLTIETRAEVFGETIGYTATAFAEGEVVKDERGRPIELISGSEDGAVGRMWKVLEQRFGPPE